MPRNVNPVPQYFDSAGNPLVGGKMFYFLSGTNTPLVTFADVNEDTPNTDPVLLTGDGRLPNVFFSVAAKQILEDVNGVQIFERDPVSAGSAEGFAPDWDALTIYEKGAVVNLSEALYISIIAGNVNQNPGTSPLAWSQFDLLNRWNVNETFAIDDVVRSDAGIIYTAVTANTGNDPDADTSGTNWKMFDNVRIDGNTISTTDTNGDLVLAPDGTGSVTTAAPLTAAQLNADNTRLDGNTLSATDTDGDITVQPDNDGNINLDLPGTGLILSNGVDIINFRGAVVARTTTAAIGNSTPTEIGWQTENIDTDDIYSGSGPDLVVPSGVTRVRLKAQVGWFANATGTRTIRIGKDVGAGTIFNYSCAGFGTKNAVSSGGTYQDVSTPVLIVEAGDIFVVSITQTSGGNLSITADETWFSMEIIPTA